MKIERLVLRPSGRVVPAADGPLCWYDEAADLQRQLAEAQAMGEKLVAGFNQVTRERDAARGQLEAANARINLLIGQRRGE